MSPISLPSLDSPAGAPLQRSSSAKPITAHSDGRAAPRMNWGRTWLGQTESPPEVESDTDSPPEPVQWLTLLPSVPAFQNLLAIEEESETAADEVPSLNAPIVVPALPLTLPASEPEVPAAPASLSPQISTSVNPAEQPSPARPDKGELIWAAEFVIAETASDQPGANDSTLPKVSAAGNQSRQGESEPDRQDPSREGPAPEGAQSEVPAAALNTPAGKAQFEIAGPSAASETNDALAVGSVELETARPLRPAQIATLYVDVPAPSGAADAAPLRLAVTQRGDQVNVRLRSWDAAAAPLETSRMQPLLQSLAEQGYEAAKSVDRLDESARMSPEHFRERPLAATESAGANNDQQPFQNPDDRQRKNQERQQQAFFLRRQMQSLNAETFDLQAQLEDTRSSQHQGAVR